MSPQVVKVSNARGLLPRPSAKCNFEGYLSRIKLSSQALRIRSVSYVIPQNSPIGFEEEVGPEGAILGPRVSPTSLLRRGTALNFGAGCRVYDDFKKKK